MAASVPLEVNFVNRVRELLTTPSADKARRDVYVFGFTKLLLTFGGLLPTEIPVFGLRLSEGNKKFVFSAIAAIIIYNLLLLALEAAYSVSAFYFTLAEIDVEKSKESRADSEGFVGDDGQYSEYSNATKTVGTIYAILKSYRVFIVIFIATVSYPVPILFGIFTFLF